MFLNFYYVYEGVCALVNTSLFTLNRKFCPSSLRMTPESENGYLKILIRLAWDEKISVGGGLGALQFYWSLFTLNRKFFPSSLRMTPESKSP